MKFVPLNYQHQTWGLKFDTLGGFRYIYIYNQLRLGKIMVFPSDKAILLKQRRVLGLEYIYSLVIETTWIQWLFLPLKGGRWHIIPQLAVYIPLIYHLYIALRGIICYLPPFRGTISTTLDELHQILQWIQKLSSKTKGNKNTPEDYMPNGKSSHLKIYLYMCILLNMVIFHCHVSFRGCDLK